MEICLRNAPNCASTTHIASARAEQFQAKADSLLSWPAVSAQPFTCVSLFNLKQKASLNRASDWQRERRKALPFEMACIDEMRMKWAHLFSLKWKEGGGGPHVRKGKSIMVIYGEKYTTNKEQRLWSIDVGGVKAGLTIKNIAFTEKRVWWHRWHRMIVLPGKVKIGTGLITCPTPCSLLHLKVLFSMWKI